MNKLVTNFTELGFTTIAVYNNNFRILNRRELGYFKYLLTN